MAGQPRIGPDEDILRDFFDAIGWDVTAYDSCHLMPVPRHQLRETINVALQDSLDDLKIFRHRRLRSVRTSRVRGLPFSIIP
jgi:hypothetical protein